MKLFRPLALGSLLAFSLAELPARATLMIAVGGGSRSGKTTIATRLAEAIQKQLGSVCKLSQDDYFNPKEQPEEHFRDYSYKDIDGKYWNFDHPTALDWDLMKEDLATIKDGKAVHPPKYHFGTGGLRELQAGPRIESPDFLIFEGIHALSDEISPLFHFRVFIEVPEEIQKVRLVAAGRERKQSQKDTDSYLPILNEAFQNYILPTHKNAHLILKGDQDLDLSIELILEQIKKLSEPKPQLKVL